MKHNIKFWKNLKKWIPIISSFLLFFIISVLWYDTKITLKNNYELTNNKIYIILFIILVIIRYSSYFRYF
jgi:hypothetical protein